MKKEITKEIDESIQTTRELKLQTSLILEIAENVADSIKNGGVLAKIAKKVVKVPSNNTQRIQESHILIGHLLVGTVEKTLH